MKREESRMRCLYFGKSKEGGGERIFFILFLGEKRKTLGYMEFSTLDELSRNLSRLAAESCTGRVVSSELTRNALPCWLPCMG